MPLKIYAVLALLGIVLFHLLPIYEWNKLLLWFIKLPCTDPHNSARLTVSTTILMAILPYIGYFWKVVWFKGKVKYQYEEVALNGYFTDRLNDIKLDPDYPKPPIA